MKALRRPTGPGEASIALRACVFAATLIAVLAVLTSGAGGPLHWLGSLIVLPLGCLVSYRLRDERPVWLPALVGTLLIGGLTLFMLSVARQDAATSSELRAPLVELLVWVAIVRSFDLRHRRDLLFALAGSGALVAVAAAISTSAGFALALVPWAVAALLSLAVAHRRDLAGDAAPPPAHSEVRRVAPATVSFLSVVAALGTLIFLVAPAPRVSSAFLSSALPRGLGVGVPGELSNAQRREGQFDYIGFTERLDTSLRGRLGEDIVMRVRASAPDFWRGQTFDRWDGRAWTLSEPRPFLLPTAEPARLPDLPGEAPVLGAPSFVQTFFFERPGPNLIFAANRASAVYFPETTLFELTDGTIRTGNELLAGASYTVLSNRPLTTGAGLRRLGTAPEDETSPAFRTRYTHLPEIPQRVRDLAEQVTRGEGSTYDKVRALERWIGANTRYSLDIPVVPSGVDAVDHFLFEDRVGFCEQIASSLVVMLRSRGVAARLATGFTPGERNPLTGLFEVRSKNAHAWAEVYFPGVGWQAFDPTAKVPLAGEQAPTRAGSGLIGYVSRRVGVLVGTVAAFVATVGVALLAAIFVRRGRRRRTEAARPWWALTLARLSAGGAGLGRPRRPNESALDFVACLPISSTEREQLQNAATTIEQDAFASTPASPHDRAGAEAAVARLERLVSERQPRRPRLR